MDESQRHFNPNPILSANFISKGFFWWLNPLFKKGHKKELDVEDMYNVTPQDSSDCLGSALEKEWLKEVRKGDSSETTSKPSLLKALFRLFGLRYILLGLVIFTEESVRVVQPLLLGGLIQYFTPNSSVTDTEAYMYALGVSLCAMVITVAHHPYFFEVGRIGMQMRVACCSVMFKKALQLGNTALGKTTTGQIVNLMSNDVNRFDKGVYFLHFLWIGPLQAIVVLVILWYEIGPSVMAGFAVLILLVPVQTILGKVFSRLRLKTAIHTDARVKVMNEIITGMRVIKMYCWEKAFQKVVEKLRRSELDYVWSKKCVNAFTSCVWVVAHRVLSYAFVVAHVAHGGTLRVAPLYIGLAFMFLIAYNGIGCVFEAIARFCEFYVAAERIQTFLLLDEPDERQTSVPYMDLQTKAEDCRVSIENFTAKWNEEMNQNTLEQISASVQAGQLLAVIGPVGAGKSSLLMAILGELRAFSGSVSVMGKVTYAAQQAWVFSGSLRQNILFGSPYNKKRFDSVVYACALHKDLEILPERDSTLIGDRGVSLSGGQRARVSLARALYSGGDIFLLDDPLSAVDAAVGRHIFNRCIQGVLKNKPRILVTHQLQYLSAADSVLILKEGKAIGMGTYEELSKSGIDFAELLKKNEDEAEKPAVHSRLAVLDQAAARNVNNSRLSLISAVSDLEPEAVQIVDEEERQSGTVGVKVYREFFRAGAGILVLFLLVICCVLAQCVYIASDWWLSRWSTAEEDRLAAMEEHKMLLSQGFNTTNITIPIVDTYQNIYIFSGIIGGVFVFGMLRALMFFRMMVNASQTLHNRMFAKILCCPIGFFDINPVGRILNRFTKDVGHIDDDLPISFFDFIQCLLLILGIILVAAGINPYVLIPSVPIVLLFFYIRSYYLATSRSIKRLEGTCRSPVFSYLSAALQGLHTIRAFKMVEKCQEEFDSHQDLHTEAFFLLMGTNRWLALRLDLLCWLFVTAVVFCAVLSVGSLDAGMVGLSVTYSMTLMGLFQWAVRQSAEVENQMVSVERVLEYSHLQSEAALETDEKDRPPENWPRGGSIQADNLCLRYFRSSPMVLKNLNFHIKEREKVGIVGRTGAGKSSLIAALFRLAEPSGNLFIDGVDVLRLGLHDLRSAVSIIPQDPVLFTGTLRSNLDPFSKHDDEKLWKALSEVQLKAAVKELHKELEMSVSEGGVNFSVGQRQLVCLARAILLQNRILILDEATANVDPRTDKLIQETIRAKFSECTVLTIAHRIHTIMDSDRVMVMSDGQVVEFDSPHVLLQQESGLFYRMVQQLGKTDAEQLTAEAATAAACRCRHGDGQVGACSNIPVPLNSNRSSIASQLNSETSEVLPEQLSESEDVSVRAPLAPAESFHSVLEI